MSVVIIGWSIVGSVGPSQGESQSQVESWPVSRQSAPTSLYPLLIERLDLSGPEGLSPLSLLELVWVKRCSWDRIPLKLHVWKEENGRHGTA